MQGFSNIEISCSVLFLPARATNYYSENMTLKFQSEFSPFEIKTNFIVRFFTHGLKGHWNTKARRISWGWRLKTLFARCTAVKNKNNKQTMHSCKIYFLSYGDGRIERQMGAHLLWKQNISEKKSKRKWTAHFFCACNKCCIHEWENRDTFYKINKCFSDNVLPCCGTSPLPLFLPYTSRFSSSEFSLILTSL